MLLLSNINSFLLLQCIISCSCVTPECTYTYSRNQYRQSVSLFAIVIHLVYMLKNMNNRYGYIHNYWMRNIYKHMFNWQQPCNLLLTITIWNNVGNIASLNTTCLIRFITYCLWVVVVKYYLPSIYTCRVMYIHFPHDLKLTRDIFVVHVFVIRKIPRFPSIS